jgi:hypothetical protein
MKPQGPTVSAYQALVVDPCSGPLVSPYGGPRGYITRFTSDITINTGVGITSGTLQYFPGVCATLTTNNTSGAAGALVQTASGPGAAYLTNTCNAVRAVAACFEVIPSGASYNNLTGEIGFGYCDWNTAGGGANVVPNNMFQLCTARSVLSKSMFEAKWTPGDSDHLYNQINNGAATFVPALNSLRGLLLCWRDCPANVGLTVRITAVLEWIPDVGQGLAYNAAPATPVDHRAQVAQIAHRAGTNWWHNLTAGAGSVAAKFATGVAHDAAAAGRYMIRGGLAKLASRAAPLMLTL